MGVHLTNTFLLLGALAPTADWSARPGGMRPADRGAIAGALWLAFVTMILAGVTGAIAALGDTLFPTTSFAEGLRQELSSEAHVLLRLRILHPFAAVAAAAVPLLAREARAEAPARCARPPAGAALVVLVAVEILLGVVNVALLAPVWPELVHLLVADLVWIALVLLAAASLAPGPIEAPERRPPPCRTAARLALACLAVT